VRAHLTRPNSDGGAHRGATELRIRQIVASNELLKVVTDIAMLLRIAACGSEPAAIDSSSNAVIATVPAVIGGWLA